MARYLKQFGKTLAIILPIAIIACSKKSGCIDPNAANYEYEAQKNDGNCLYDMSFYMNTGKHGFMRIYVDGELKDSLTVAWILLTPRCGVDTFIYTNQGVYKGTANVALKPGNHEVRVEASDGSVWEKSYKLEDNCLSILVGAAE